MHFRCVHGVAVYLKYTLRQESARDYVDALLSFKERPKVVISDISSQVCSFQWYVCKIQLNVGKFLIEITINLNAAQLHDLKLYFS